MLPSMPILFNRDSLDAFGNKIIASTNFCNKNNNEETAIMCAPQPSTSKEVEPSTSTLKTATITKPEEQKSELNSQCNIDRETEWCSRYIKKVQSRLAPNNRAQNAKILQFKDILKSFNPNKETPIDLHLRLKEFFGEQHKELSDDFLLFLKPEQALQIGEYSNQIILSKMKSFIDTLISTYARKPTVVRKIVRAITNSVKCGSVDEMRSRVLPHLRSSPRLTALFRALFPDERVPESVLESGVEKLSEDFLTNDDGFERLELEDVGDTRRNLNSKDTLDTMYLQGRVFLQYGRNLRPANITFPYSKEPYRNHVRRLAPLLYRVSPPHSSDEDTATRKNKRTNKRNNKQTKSQTNKDVNDNTKHKRTDSPKTTNKTQTRTKKDLEKELTKTKKERQDSKGDKKEEPPKAKQAKLDTLVDEVPKTKSKIETEVKAESKHTKTEFIENKNKLNNSTSTQKAKVKDTTAVNEVPKIKLKETGKCDMKKHIKVDAKIKSTDSINIETNEIPKAKQAKLEVTAVTQSKLEVGSWTRDEDKTLLQVLKGETLSEHVFGKINRLLPHRSETEIKERFLHVMKLVQKMAVGEVT